MKKISFLVGFIILCSFAFALSVNPSMDGRAVVADNGVFPPGGYYGRAPGYLPGDTVIVTNHNNGFSIDVLILGSYDAYEGIAILLSPEAAEKLQITKGKDVYVKVQKKQPIPYEEAVATSRNKKVTEKQAVDSDKDSRVLPGVTDELLNETVASQKKLVVPEDDIELPYEDIELDTSAPKALENYFTPVTEEIVQQENSDADSSVEELPVEGAELAEIENEEVLEDDYILVENFQDEVAEEQPVIEETEIAESELKPVEDDSSTESETNSEVAEVENELIEEPEEAILAEPEEYVESESIDAPVFVEEIPQEETQVVEVPEEIKNEDEVVLDDIHNDDYDVTDVIDSPVENEVAQVEPEQVLDPELPVEDSEEVAEDTDEQPIEEVAENTESIDITNEAELATEDEFVAENSELEEILIPEEEIALEEIPEEILSEEVALEEITTSEILDTDVLEEEPELVVLDDQYENEKSESSMSETPKDIFSMIVGENPDEEILQDVVLEETDPKLPEADDLLDSEYDTADMQITLDQPEIEPVTNIAQVVVSEKEEAKILPSLMKEEYSEVDEFKNTVSNFNDLPKVKQTKSKTYYIQIATVSSKENVAKMVEVHGQKYPVYVLQNSSKNMYQILIGPLNDDEYALVLARFKQTYKDAFLRVLK